MGHTEDSDIRVMIVDDHTVVRMGLRMVIDAQPDMRVVGEAATRTEALNVAAGGQPNVVLLDLDLGSDNGITLMPELTAAAPGINVLIITGLRDLETQRQSVRTGAMGVVMKDTSLDTVVKAIRRVHGGEIWLDRSMIASVLQEEPRAREVGGPTDGGYLASLTPREREIIVEVSVGLKNQQIADRLHISEATVRHHLTSIFSKLDVADRLSLVVYAFRNGLASLDA
jgi:two-component system, NarL family, nitrate/nitrite response regulator NarL